MKKEVPDFSEFPKVTYDQWKSEAQHLLKNEDPEVKLGWHSQPGLNLKAYYDSSSTRDLGYLSTFFSNLPAKDWVLYERIPVTSEKEANALAHNSLMGGCQGVLFTGDFEQLAIKKLLNGILPEHCHLAFQHTGKGSVKLDAGEKIKGFGQHVIHEGTDFFTDVFEEKDDLNLIEKSALLIIQSLESLQRPESSKGLVFILKPGKDFFHELARVRAMRLLVSNLMTHQSGKSLLPIHIHLEPQPGATEGAHLLAQTTAGLAGLIGGADSIVFHPGNAKWASNGAHRVSRNIGNLIRHESKLGKHADFSSGSYFIDALTDQLARSIWREVKNQRK